MTREEAYIGGQKLQTYTRNYKHIYENSKLYKAQLKILAITDIKPNAWERDYGTDHLKLRSLARKSWAHSQIRGFNWLLASHALPVATQMKGKDSCNTCKCCGKADETIRHMALWMQMGQGCPQHCLH